MLKSAFKLGEEMSLRTLPYIVHPSLWTRYNLSGINLGFSSWTKIKYLNNNGTGFHSDIKKLPNDKGGLYLFYIPSPVITGITEYPFYIGRAQLSQGQNLRKRCREYYTLYAKDDERPKITTMINYWGKHLHLAFKVLPNNIAIVDYEKKLINSLLLPMNDEIPDQEIRQGVKAFFR